LVFQELKSDFDRLRTDGTLDLLLQLQTGQAPQVDAAPAATARAMEHAAATQLAITDIRADARAQHTMLANLLAATERASAATPAPAPQQPMAVNITNHIPEQRAGDTHIHVPETTVTVEATMPTPAVEVRNEITTAAPDVHVTNQVQPATVAVDVTATMPTRISETVIERAPGTNNIVRSTTTERDA
jgi:hypothetical protein